MKEPTDEDVARAVRAGEKQAFALLVERYEGKLSRYLSRFVSDAGDTADLLQETFAKSYVHIRSFDPSRSFSSWIYRIAHNEAIGAIRKKGRERISFFDLDTVFPHFASSETADGDLSREETKQLMDECLSRLPPKYREALVLYYYEEMDYAGIAAVLHVPVSTVGVRLRRAKEKLKAIHDDITQPHA